MSPRDCDGWVQPSLHGHVVAFTGKVHVDGTWVQRPECERLARERGATCQNDFSRRLTLIVEGDQEDRYVTDMVNRHTKKLTALQRTREMGGAHIHLVDEAGFGDLLAG